MSRTKPEYQAEVDEKQGQTKMHFDNAAFVSLVAVTNERRKQDKKWGEQNHDPFTWLTILAEEFGEFAQAALHTRFGGSAAEGLHEEAVHVAAVALAMVECLHREKWQWPEVAKGERDVPEQAVT